MTTPETAAETAADAKMTSAAKVPSADKVASATAEPPSPRQNAMVSVAMVAVPRAKCCSNCNHHFAH